MDDLTQKRQQSCLVIVATVFSIALVAAAPKINPNFVKEIFLTVADVAMCMMIWNIYLQENLYQKNIKSILLELFLVIVVIGITAYITSRGITVLSSKLTPRLGRIGWWIVGAIAALVTAILGIAWTFYCNDLYRNLK
jgi:hypothetical protein